MRTRRLNVSYTIFWFLSLLKSVGPTLLPVYLRILLFIFTCVLCFLVYLSSHFFRISISFRFRCNLYMMLHGELPYFSWCYAGQISSDSSSAGGVPADGSLQRETVAWRDFPASFAYGASVEATGATTGSGSGSGAAAGFALTTPLQSVSGVAAFVGPTEDESIPSLASASPPSSPSLWVFHRGAHEWAANTFDPVSYLMRDEQVAAHQAPTWPSVFRVDRDSGAVIPGSAFGGRSATATAGSSDSSSSSGNSKTAAASGSFLGMRMPHSVAASPDGAAVWVVDTGAHQVHRFSASDSDPHRRPLLTIGVRNQPGGRARHHHAHQRNGRSANDGSASSAPLESGGAAAGGGGEGWTYAEPDAADGAHTHLCQPTHAVEARDGRVYVADGYCASRVLVFDAATGRRLATWPLSAPASSASATSSASNRHLDGVHPLPHSLAIGECERLLFVADRELARIVALDLDTGAERWAVSTWTRQGGGGGLPFALRVGPYGSLLALVWDRDGKRAGASSSSPGADASSVSPASILAFDASEHFANGLVTESKFKAEYPLPGVTAPHDFAVIAAPLSVCGSGERRLAVVVAETLPLAPASSLSGSVASDALAGLKKFVFRPADEARAAHPMPQSRNTEVHH